MKKKFYCLTLDSLFVVGQATISFADGKVSYKPGIINVKQELSLPSSDCGHNRCH
jgi:hypothetical protein